MNGYIAHYKGQKKEVFAETSYAAQVEAAKLFKAKKTYDVTILLVEKEKVPVLIDTASL